jgi:hypothetical protein
MDRTFDLREVLLAVISEQALPNDGGNLQQGSVLREVALRTGAVHDLEREQAVLSQFSDLFRTGYLAWGFNLANPSPPFFHVTTSGRRILERVARDPGNPAGYRRHLASIADVNPVAQAYVDEGVECYSNGFFRAAAVMIGAAAESLVLELAEVIYQTGDNTEQPYPKDLKDWRLKKILDALQSFFSTNKNTMEQDLKDEFEAYWAAFAQQVRAVRNEAGHPSSVSPVTSEAVHASLLIFPELAKLHNKLLRWVLHVWS